MGMSAQTNELATALAAAQAEMKAADLARINPHFKSKFAGLPEVRESAKVLHKHGLAFTQDVWTEGEHCEIACCSTTILHKSGQWKESPALKLRAVQATPQGVGSALTYARRYSLSAQLGIVADEDDDGNEASRGAPKAQSKPPPPGNSHTAMTDTKPAPPKPNGRKQQAWQGVALHARTIGFDCGDDNAKLWSFCAQHSAVPPQAWGDSEYKMLCEALDIEMATPEPPASLPESDIPF